MVTRTFKQISREVPKSPDLRGSSIWEGVRESLLDKRRHATGKRECEFSGVRSLYVKGAHED